MCLYSAAVVGIIMLLPGILQLPRTRLFGGEKANNMRSIVKENQRAILLHGLFCIQYFLMLSMRYLCFAHQGAWFQANTVVETLEKGIQVMSI